MNPVLRHRSLSRDSGKRRLYIMEKPIVLVVMDGVGKGDGGSGDAVAVAKTPTLDRLLATCPILT